MATPLIALFWASIVLLGALAGVGLVSGLRGQ
jgi:hypothetical protein